MLTVSDLENRYGRAITSQELAKFLRIDRRTVVKYADRWGGVEVAPGCLRFFEKRIEEKLNAEFDSKARQAPLASERASEREKPSKTVPGRHQNLKKASGVVGRGSKEADGKRARNRHGLIDSA